MEPSELPAPPPIEMAEMAEVTEMAEMAEENGSAPAAPEAPVDPDPSSYSMPPVGEDEEGELPADFERLWKAANDNPQDFTSWTDLLQYCEQEVCGKTAERWWCLDTLGNHHIVTKYQCIITSNL